MDEEEPSDPQTVLDRSPGQTERSQLPRGDDAVLIGGEKCDTPVRRPSDALTIHVMVKSPLGEVRPPPRFATGA